MSRQFERHATALGGRLHAGAEDAAAVECDILDLSAGGAKVRPKAGPAEAAFASLEIGSLGRFGIEVMWSRDGMLGLKFLDGPDAMADVVMAVALYG